MPSLDAMAGWLLAVSWQLLPLTAIVIALDFALRRAGPVVRSALWWMVLAKLVVPPGLASPVSIAQLWPVDAARVTAAATATDRTIDAGTAGPASSLLMLALLAIWVAGAIAAAALGCWRFRRVRAACLEGAVLLTDTAPDIHDDAVVAAARQLGMSRQPLPPIFVAARCSDCAPASHIAHVAGLPAVIGFFRPCIVLPRPLLNRPRGEIEHVLLHELAHVRRGDPLRSLVCLVAQIVFWFHPAIWCARWRLAMLREMACDRTVARLLGAATPAYRRTLILLARSSALATTATAAAASSGSTSASAAASRVFGADGPGALGLFQRQAQLVTRLEALARPVSMRRATERGAGAAIALAILVSCVPLATPRAAPTASIDVPPLELLPGSLQKRYAVMRALALEEQARARQPSR